MRSLLLACAMFTGGVLCAQKEIFHFDALTIDKAHTTLIPDQRTHGLFVVYITEDYAERFFIGSAGKATNLLHQSNLKDERFLVNAKVDERLQKFLFQSNYAGLWVRGTKLLEAALDGNSSDLVFLQTDLRTGVSALTDTIAVRRKEDVLFTFETDSSFFVVVKPRNTSYFLFHEKQWGRKAKTDTLRIEVPSSVLTGEQSFAKNVGDINDLANNEEVEVLPNNLWIPVHALQSTNKAFVQNNRLVTAISDNKGHRTTVISIDLATRQYTVKEFDACPQESAVNEDRSVASLIIDSVLVNAVAIGQHIDISVYNIASGALMATKTVTDENYGEISNGAITKVGSFWSRSDLEEIALKTMISKAIDNQLILSGYIEKNQLYLTFGSRYKRLFNATLLGNVMTLGAADLHETKPPTVVYFHTSFQLPGLAPLHQPLRNAVWDKMIQHAWSNKLLPKDMSVIYQDGFYYIGYFSGLKRGYVIYRFDEKMD